MIFIKTISGVLIKKSIKPIVFNVNKIIKSGCISIYVFN